MLIETKKFRKLVSKFRKPASGYNGKSLTKEVGRPLWGSVFDEQQGSG